MKEHPDPNLLNWVDKGEFNKAALRIQYWYVVCQDGECGHQKPKVYGKEA